MMASSSSSELSLECKPHSYSMLLKSFGDQLQQQQQQKSDNSNQNSQKLEEFLSRLEEERLKIDAFKRELPLCMQLLTNAMEASRQQLQSYRADQGPRPVLEEFIPLKNSSSSNGVDDHQGGEKVAMNIENKANWMTSAQLWSDQGNQEAITKASNSPNKENDNNIGFSMSPKVVSLDSNNRTNNVGGAFLPFSKDRSPCPTPTLALASCDHNNNTNNNKGNNNIMEDNKIVSEIVSSPSKSTNNSHNGDISTIGQPNGQLSTVVTVTTTNTTAQQPQRKARRCWSPDLHRRFVNALQMLGGSQVATPKQIRELMKVDGLTNDEVKSHLQKYRLHTRRPIIPSPQTGASGPPQLVVLGGIWVPPEYAAAAHGGPPGTTLYGAHPSPPPHVHPVSQQPIHYAPTPPQVVSHHEFYAAAAPPPLHQLHHLHMYNPPTPHPHTITRSSPGSGGGDRSESIEDGGKSSESGGSWKADSGSENAGERNNKGLVLRGDGDEGNNGTQISLKF